MKNGNYEQNKDIQSIFLWDFTADLSSIVLPMG
jgi:hypothetical protein